MAFEDRLRSALEDAVKFCNSGSTPDEAVCKSASAAGFNSDQTDRLVETLNTAITLNQYKNASDRTKSFPLAHKTKVAEMMLDADKVLGKSEKKAEAQHIYFDYMKPAYDYVKHADDVEVKAAGSDDKTTGLSLDNLAYLSIKQMKMFKNAADYADNVAGIIKGDLVTRLYALADSVKKAGVTKYARFKSSTTHNDVIKELDKVLPAEFKKAECNDALIDDSDLADFEKAAEDMANDMVSLKEMRDQAKAMHKQASDMEAQINDAFVEKKEGPSTFFGLFKQAAIIRPADVRNAIEKQVVDPMASAAFGKGILDGYEGYIHSKPVTTGLDEIFFKNRKKENDEIEATLENLRRSLLIEDLMMKDPIISEADPDTVISTYKSLIHTSPNVANNKEVVRAVLRQAINSVAISPYDAKTWADLEKTQIEGRKMERV